MRTAPRFTRRAALGAGVGLLAAPALAQTPRDPARVRLVSGGADGATLLAGVAIDLSPGWKTYWRVPGDSGVAPRFDFSASRNLAAASVLFPAPERLSDGFGAILGYSRSVVLPVRVRPADPGRPVELALALDYGVCEQVCIPLRAAARERLGDGAPADRSRIAAAIARVPRPVAAGTAVSDLRLDREARVLSFTARLAGGARHAVVEGPPGVLVGLPRIDAYLDGAIRAVARLEPPPPGAAPAPGAITVVGDLLAVEETRSLDG
jgi:DsbC/DsbD-like thiol-disulfide interchange protein